MEAVVSTQSTGGTFCAPYMEISSVDNFCYDGNVTALSVSAVAIIIIGLILVIGGYRIVKAFIVVVGLLVGFYLSYIVLTSYISVQLSLGWKLGISIGFGVIVGGENFLRGFPQDL
eukprot:TRINITY_DN3716_c0_g1_i2.p1 TRINITY_DN3716_c0_g1~~TRINITY_DN3716_c0_g1_i2.p1  ORF type:complete len:116 (-),score=22.87 TRINITY_DN3716_c0_g1_i2:555-902(-)